MAHLAGFITQGAYNRQIVAIDHFVTNQPSGSGAP